MRVLQESGAAEPHPHDATQISRPAALTERENSNLHAQARKRVAPTNGPENPSGKRVLLLPPPSSKARAGALNRDS
jgi:hypothetical protein